MSTSPAEESKISPRSPEASSPLVSIILTTYNLADCVAEAMDSLISQSYSALEIIVVDDASTDGTLDILKSYAAHDERIRLLQGEHKGAGHARNIGLSQAHGVYVMILDGDDIFNPQMVEHLVRHAQHTRSEVCVCLSEEIDHTTGERSEIPWSVKQSQLPEDVYEGFGRADHDAKLSLDNPYTCAFDRMPGNIFAAFMGWPWDKLYRRDLITAHNLRFPTDMNHSEDLLFVYPALLQAKRISVVSEVLISHRMGRGTSVSSSRAQNIHAFYDAIVRMKSYVRNVSSGEKLMQQFLNWAFDWTLWNIETLPDKEVAARSAAALAHNTYAELELSEHPAEYFTQYPRSMARYASLLLDFQIPDADKGPLGPLKDLPYGAYKPWFLASIPEKIAIKWRTWRARPTEW